MSSMHTLIRSDQQFGVTNITTTAAGPSAWHTDGDEDGDENESDNSADDTTGADGEMPMGDSCCDTHHPLHDHCCSEHESHPCCRPGESFYDTFSPETQLFFSNATFLHPYARGPAQITNPYIWYYAYGRKGSKY